MSAYSMVTIPIVFADRSSIVSWLRTRLVGSLTAQQAASALRELEAIGLAQVTVRPSGGLLLRLPEQVAPRRVSR